VNPADPFAVVKECKGAALSLLVLLETNRELGGGAVTQEWLERHSGYTDKPVSQALAYLSETGRIAMTAAGWVLVPTPAPPPDPLPISKSEMERGNSAPPQSLPGRTRRRRKAAGSSTHQQQNRVISGDASRKLSDSPTTTTAIDPIINLNKAAEEERGVGIFPTQINLEHVQANLAAFRKWGVGRNEKTIVLSSRPGVTPEQIDAIATRLITEKRFSTGLLITAVQCGDQPVPDLPNRYAPRQELRDPRKYAEWEEE
jgi:hypothetical protein